MPALLYYVRTSKKAKFKVKKYFVYIYLMSFCHVLMAQVNNDDCFSAINIPDLSDFCSTGFSNIGATSGSEDEASCWGSGDEESDIWYSITPRNAGLLLRFFGSGPVSSGTINNVGIAIYEGRCSTLVEVDCNRRDQDVDDIFERIYTTLVIGRVYYIRVSSSARDAGTFQLCLSEFKPIPEPQQDCNSGVVLCDKSTFVVEQLEGAGLISDEANDSCLDGLSPDSPPNIDPDPTETSSVWYKWTALTSGSLTFTLTPNNDDPLEDLDFAIYRLVGGINDCVNKEILRCMASGGNGPGSPVDDRPCRGPTGLMVGDGDIVEYAGCETGDNSFLSPLNMIAGESYALIVNNYSNTGFGFTIEFGGTGEFLGPTPDFAFSAIDDFECDKTITFENESTSTTDMIVDYRWSFGDGAQPSIADGEGPHDIIYETFGPKIAALTVMTARGCQVTKIIDLEVASCCDDQVQLMLSPTAQNLSCFESEDGRITAAAVNGSPEYLFSLDGSRALPTDVFNGLSVGQYELSAVDIKGCKDSVLIDITQPEEILLTLMGPTDTIQLGSSAQFFSDFSPFDRQLIYTWTPPDGLSCTDCPNPMVTPPGTSLYTLTVEDQDGCIQSTEILIFAEGEKPLYAPNIISLSPSDPANGLFRVYSDISADQIEVITIYDRWGSEVYEEKNIGLEEQTYLGWDGITRGTGRQVNPGVFIWLAKVRFIDGDVRTFTGDVTVVN